MTFPKLTIITPSYNQGRYLEKTIKSVVEQSYPNLEYLIFDGGSSDNSLQIIKKYAKKYSFIRWSSKKDGGQVEVINQGLKQSTGSIVSYINSDDYYLPHSFKKVAIFFNKNPNKEWVVGDCRVTEKKLVWTFILKRIAPFHLTKIGLEIYNPINQPAVFLKKELIKKTGKFNSKLSYAFDYDYWLRCAKSSLPGRIWSPLATFRIHKKSKGNTGYVKQFDEDYEVIKAHTQNIVVLPLHFITKYLVFAFYKFLK